jgi:alkanesulfonate monooxygenase SsuD/methylene tetrahydromethanopterin reductase-like flavin-dependent oxidoreductase (luciferase family)
MRFQTYDATVRIGLALPHYDFSVPGDGPLAFETIARCARQAESLHFDSLWVSDHLSLSIEKYGGGPGEYFAYEPLTTLAALAGTVTRPRLGTLVLCEALRPAAVAAKALATLDRISGGRLDVGIGAGWYAPDYAAIGRELPTPGERLKGLEEALIILDGLLGGGPMTFAGSHHRAEAAANHPAAVQSPRPPLIVGGKGDRLLALIARRADGWNTCWAWTPEDWAERAAVLDRACERAGRDPQTVSRSLGLYALAGEDERDLAARWQRMQRSAPNGMLDKVSLDEWRIGRLVGTVEEVAEQAAGWASRGVGELIVCAGPLPFSVADPGDLDVLASALAGVRQ